jgi:hypothetical protein
MKRTDDKYCWISKLVSVDENELEHPAFLRKSPN